MRETQLERGLWRIEKNGKGLVTICTEPPASVAQRAQSGSARERDTPDAGVFFQLKKCWTPMRSSILYKLFLANFLTVVIAVAIVGTATHLSFTHGFLGYVNKLAVDRAEIVRSRIEQAYAEHGSWDFIRESPRVWFFLQRSSSMKWPPEDHPPDADSPASDLTGALPRMGLVDSQHQWLAGYKDYSEDMLKFPVRVNGLTVGWVTLVSFQSVTGEGNERFQNDQAQAIVAASLVVVLLAGLAAYSLARLLLRPARELAQATHQLAAGHYDSRVKVRGRDEISQLARDFNHLAQTLQRNEQVRRNFMAEISHELRTPLAILRGELDAMTDGIRPMTPKAITSLQAEVTTLSQLVNDLYEVSLTDVGALSYRFQSVDLLEVLNSTVDACQTRLALHRMHLHVVLPDRPVLLNADESRLRQLLNNLLENSLRYTDADGDLRVAVRTETKQCIIEWQDSKPGVPDDLLPHLFKRFVRGPEESSWPGTRGAGLGLAICRNIVEAHGGSIEASHSPLGGLRIVITFPCP